MKTNKILTFATFSFVAIVVAISVIGLSQYLAAWFFTDIIVGVLLFVGYLVSTLKYGPAKFLPYSKNILRV